MNALLSPSASALAQAIRSKKITAKEVVEAHLQRIAEVNPALNAVVQLAGDRALEEARLADQALLKGAKVGPLHGVPVTTKVNLDQKGLPTDGGVVEFKNLIAPQDNPTIANMRKAGAIIVGRTNTPCFSMRWFTDNALHGRLFVGPPQPIAALGSDPVESLKAFKVVLTRDGRPVDAGRGSNVIGSPLGVIDHLTAVLAQQGRGEDLKAGEIVTTGTLTAAWPVATGQVWRTRIEGIALPGLEIAFA